MKDSKKSQKVNQMKITKATKKAVKARSIPPSAKNGKTAISAKARKKNASKGKRTPAKPLVAAEYNKLFAAGKRAIMIALLSGARGFCARTVEVVTAKDGTRALRAVQNNLGLPERESLFAPLSKDSVITSEANRMARVQLGGYVNGRNTGAKVELMSPAQFATRSKPCLVHWNVDDKGIPGRYIGDPSVKGMVAVSVQYGSQTYFWQMEQDSNANNKHERGCIKPIGKTPLVIVK